MWLGDVWEYAHVSMYKYMDGWMDGGRGAKVSKPTYACMLYMHSSACTDGWTVGMEARVR